jgi:hypothetical protein
MKGYIYCVLWVLSVFAAFLTLNFSSVFASRNAYSEQPFGAEKVLDQVVNNSDKRIIESPLDEVTRIEGQFDSDSRISNTLDSLRQNLSQYLNWILFLGLSGATILIVYNGLLMVTTPLTWDQLEKVKKRLINILVWVLVMTGFYFIIKVTLSIMNLVLE